MEISKIIAGMTVLGFIVGAVLAAEDRYVNVAENIQSMQQMQQYYEKKALEQDKKLDAVQYQFLQDRRRTLEREAQANPTNPFIRNDLKIVEERLYNIEQKMMQ